MKRIFIILLVLIAILAAGGFFLVKKAITPVELPPVIVDAEEAMAAPGTIAIASVDMTYLRRVNKLLNAGQDASPLAATQAKETKSLLAKLQQQGIDLSSATDYALGTINVATEKPAYSLVLFGRYSSAQLKQAVSQNYLVEESDNGVLLLSQNVKQIIDPCVDPATISAPKQQALYLQDNRILFSSPELMPVLLKRFPEKARAGVDLANWRIFRKDKAVAAAMISPGKAEKGAVDLPTSLMMGALSKQPLVALYAGAVISVLPEPGFTFHIDAHASKADWPPAAKTRYDAWFTDVVSDLKEMPTVASLIPSLDVQATGSVLRFKMHANKKTLDNLEKIPGEFTRLAFAGVFDDEQVPAVAEEEIVNDSAVEKYQPQFDFSTIAPFDEKSTIYKPGYLAGPLAINLKKIGLLVTDESIIELKVNAEGKGFENIPVEMTHNTEKSPLAGLSITSVEDLEGNNLLREEQCGKARNLATAALSITRDKELKDNVSISKSIKVQGAKTVRLKPNVSLSQLAKIKGKVAIQAATKTRVETLRAPLYRKKIEAGNLQIYFRKNTAGTVKYNVSGDTSKILAIRAKNAKGQYLAPAATSTMGDDMIMVSKNFKGKVASVEIVLAEDLQAKEYPFDITGVGPRYGKKGDGITQVDVAVTSKRNFLRQHAKMKYKDNICKDKQSFNAGPFLVCMNKFGDAGSQPGQQQTGGEFDIFAPYDEALQNDISAGLLSIDSVVTETGEEIKFDKKAGVNFVYKFEMKYNEKSKGWDVVNRMLKGSAILLSDKEEFKNKKISKVKGALKIRLPKRTSYFDLDADNLGFAEKSKDGIYANIVAFEDWNTYIDLQGPVDKVMRFLPYAKDGKLLNTANERIGEKQYHTVGLSAEEMEKIKAIPEKSQAMLTIYGKPEVIRIIYANHFETIEHKFEIPLN